jgi:hypothetical protein
VSDAGDDRMIYWRRLDVPGAELARVSQAGHEYRIEGAVLVVYGGQPYDLRYSVACDERWRTRRATIRGTAAGETVRLDIVADTVGGWQLNGVDWSPVAGCLDVDLGFTPSTNLLAVRRLALSVGEERSTRAAWLGFPELRFEPPDSALPPGSGVPLPVRERWRAVRRFARSGCLRARHPLR